AQSQGRVGYIPDVSDRAAVCSDRSVAETRSREAWLCLAPHPWRGGTRNPNHIGGALAQASENALALTIEFRRMSLAALLSFQVGNQVQWKGRQIFRAGGVKFVNVTPTTVVAQVTGNDTYEAGLHFSDGEI